MHKNKIVNRFRSCKIVTTLGFSSIKIICYFVFQIYFILFQTSQSTSLVFRKGYCVNHHSNVHRFFLQLFYPYKSAVNFIFNFC